MTAYGYPGDPFARTQLALLDTLLKPLREIYDGIFKENPQVARFRSRVEWLADDLLDESELRAVTERERYALSARGVMDEKSLAAKSVREAARRLGPWRLKLDQARENARLAHEAVRLSRMDRGPSAIPQDYVVAADQALSRAAFDYELLAVPLRHRYPLLAAAETQPGGLEALAKPVDAQWATVAWDHIAACLEHIDEARAAFGPGGAADVLEIPHLVARGKLTEEWQQLSEASQGQIDSYLTRAAAIEFVAGLLPVGIAIALAISGWGTVALALSVGLSIHDVLDTHADYAQASALARTDLDKARALVPGDPTFAWVVLAAAGLALDVADLAKAAGAVKKMVPLAFDAKVAKTPELADEAIERMHAVADEIPGLAGKIDETTARVGKDIGEIVAAGRVDDSVIAASRRVGDSTGEVAVHATGVFVCRSPCTDCAERFAPAIARDPTLKSRIQALVQRLLGSNPPADADINELLRLNREVMEAAAGSQLRDVRRLLDEHAVQEGFEALRAAVLDDAAIKRILAKRNIWHLKGQLLEELAAAYMARLTPRELWEMIGRPGADTPIKFIPGHKIRTPDGRQLSDGIFLSQLPGSTTPVVEAVLEMKAGWASAQDFAAAAKPWKGLAGVAKALRGDAIQYLRMRSLDPRVASMATDEIDEMFKAEVDRLVLEYQEAVGQVGRDLRRLTQNKRLKITGYDSNHPEVAVEVAVEGGWGSDTIVLGVVPSDVPVEQLNALHSDSAIGERFMFDKVNITHGALDHLARRIALRALDLL